MGFGYGTEISPKTGSESAFFAKIAGGYAYSANACP